MRRDPTPLARTHYSPAEAAKLLNVSERHVRSLCASGEMPAVRVGRVHRIPIEAFNAQYLPAASA